MTERDATREVDSLIVALRADRVRSAWSRSQTLEESLVKLRGEIDECLEALAANDQDHLADELGDALWSLIFALIVSEEERHLDMGRVAQGAMTKLRRRKPWLFEDGPPLSLEEEAVLWERVKARERGE
jgi:NTP pyrophosphatase (non-canonical NTP hydrolase)